MHSVKKSWSLIHSSYENIFSKSDSMKITIKVIHGCLRTSTLYRCHFSRHGSHNSTAINTAIASRRPGSGGRCYTMKSNCYSLNSFYSHRKWIVEITGRSASVALWLYCFNWLIAYTLTKLFIRHNWVSVAAVVTSVTHIAPFHNYTRRTTDRLINYSCPMNR